MVDDPPAEGSSPHRGVPRLRRPASLRCATAGAGAFGLRVSAEEEHGGLDAHEHGAETWWIPRTTAEVALPAAAK